MSLFKLIRWPNLIIMVLTMYLLRYFLLLPLLEYYGLNPQFSAFNFMLLAISVVLLSAAGYIINDVNDIDTDKINKPEAIIIGEKIRLRTAENIYLIINGVAIGVGIYLSKQMDNNMVAVSFALVAGLLYFYSTTYKGQPILGNAMVALFAALVPAMVLIFELTLLRKKYMLFTEASSSFNYNFLAIWFGSYALFAFLLTFIREVVKDMEDFEGDNAFGHRTIPVAYGIKVSKSIVVSLFGMLFIAIIYLSVRYLNNVFSLSYIVLLVLAPLAYACRLVMKANDKKSYTTASFICKIAMVTGIGYVFIIKYLILN